MRKGKRTIMTINHVIISGNLTFDPELREYDNAKVLNFQVAVNDRRKGADGEWQNYANYIGVTAFGKQAEFLSKWLCRGSKVTVEGKIHYSSWEKDGKRNSKITINADKVEFDHGGKLLNGDGTGADEDVFAIESNEKSSIEAEYEQIPY
jgi:single-strand DNA-binding protein